MFNSKNILVESYFLFIFLLITPKLGRITSSLKYVNSALHLSSSCQYSGPDDDKNAVLPPAKCALSKLMKYIPKLFIISSSEAPRIRPNITFGYLDTLISSHISLDIFLIRDSSSTLRPLIVFRYSFAELLISSFSNLSSESSLYFPGFLRIAS